MAARKTSAELEASGAFDRQPSRRRVDPKGIGELGEPPDSLSDDHKAMWVELADLVPDGVATGSDRIGFEILTDLVARNRQNHSISSAERSQLTMLLRDFALVPASRVRLATPISTKDDSTNPFAQYVSK